MMPFGPVSDHVESVLSQFDFFRAYREGKLTRAQYETALEDNAGEIDNAFDGSSHYRSLASHYPADFDTHADKAASHLVSAGLIDAKPSTDAFRRFRAEIARSYDHGENCTSIHPDEAAILYLISTAIQPRAMMAVGSYYGYWTVWAMPGVMASKGRAFLIDPNPAVSDLAEKNFSRLGMGDNTVVMKEKGEDAFPKTPGALDLVLLDAAGSNDDPDLSYRGKGIYGHLITDIFGKMKTGALLVVHNDCLPDSGPDPLAPFHDFCAAHFRRSHVVPTPGGVGVYQK